MEMVDWALMYARAGLPVLPLHTINKQGECTCGKSDCSTPGKHPRTKRGLKEATTDEKTIEKWWSARRWPKAAIGGVGGKFICLDIDAKSKGFESLETLIADNAPLPDTAVVETGEYDGVRGRHYWFRMPEDEVVSSRAGIRPGIDVRCYNGYAVMPPSVHKTGVRYEWVGGEGIETATEIPEWILELVPEAVMGDSNWKPNPHFKMSKIVKQFIHGKHSVPDGEQRQFLCRAARSILTTGADVETTAQWLWEGERGSGGIQDCDQDPANPWTEDQILYIVEDEFRKGPNSKMEKDFSEEAVASEVWKTDYGNATLLIEDFPEGHVIHIAEWDLWYIWDGQMFRENNGVTLRRKWEAITKRMVDESANKPEEERKSIYMHAVKSQSKPRIEAAVSLAKDLVAVPNSELNADPWLLNCRNGIVDLKTGELVEPMPEYYMTKQAKVAYIPGAQSDVWDKFIQKVIPDEELRAFLQKAFGYTLTGSVSEHKFFYLYGPPASGKSTLLETFAGMLGNYSESADPTTFMRNPNRNASGPTEDLARLANARMVVTHEIEESMRFAEGHISKMTGGDQVTARFLNAKTFAFYPKFKLWFSANHRPRVSSSMRSGIWRRILVIPMEQAIPEKDRDPTLSSAMQEDSVREAILAWAVEGCQEWIKDNESKHNMAVPKAVTDEVEDYKEEADHVAGFLREVVKTTKSNDDRIPKRDMFEAYLGWCEREGRKNTLTQNTFSRRLAEHGLTWKQAQYEGKRPDCWMGVVFIGIPRKKEKKE